MHYFIFTLGLKRSYHRVRDPILIYIYAKTIEESENRYANLIGNALMPPPGLLR